MCVAVCVCRRVFTLHAWVHKFAMPCISGVSSSGAFRISFTAGKKEEKIRHSSVCCHLSLNDSQSFLEERKEGGERRRARGERLETRT